MLKKDNVIFGLGISLLATVLMFGLLWLILYLMGQSVNDNSKLFLFSFIPAILLLRWYSKLQYMKTVKGTLTILFFGFCAMLYYLYAVGSFGAKL